jgi:hypothetical protein
MSSSIKNLPVKGLAAGMSEAPPLLYSHRRKRGGKANQRED